MYVDGKSVGSDEGFDQVADPTELKENYLELHEGLVARDGKVKRLALWKTALSENDVADMNKGTGMR